MILTLISHKLCPYVQRAVIALTEKGVPFERRDIDLANKPDWFLRVSPLGKTPVLLVGETPIFESAVILEYLEETQPHPLHPADPLARAEHRAWIEFGSAILNDIWGFYTAADATAFDAKAAALKNKFARVEARLKGPWFDGERFAPRRRGVRAGVPLFRCLRPHRRVRHSRRTSRSRRLAPRARVPRHGPGCCRARIPCPAVGVFPRARLAFVAADREGAAGQVIAQRQIRRFGKGKRRLAGQSG